MKIIGLTGNAPSSDIIVQMTRVELAQLAGRSSTFSKWGERWQEEMPCFVGKEYKVGDIFAYLVALSESVREMASAKKTIEAVADLLELPPSVMEISASIEAILEKTS